MKTVSLLAMGLTAALAAQSPAQEPTELFFSLSRAYVQGQTPPVDASSLDRAEIEARGARNPAELLEYLPSVSVRRMNGPYGASMAAMRGFSSKQTAVVYDDLKLPADLTGTVDFSVLPAGAIGRLEVLPGGWSPLYGANAEGGVLHIISPEQRPGTRTAKAGTSFTSHRGRFNDVKAGFADKRFSAFISGANEYSGGFQQNSEFTKNSVSGVFSYDMDSGGKLSVRGFESFSRTGLPSGTPVYIAEWNGKKERLANRLDDYQKNERNLIGISYEMPVLRDAAAVLSVGRGNNVVNAFQFGSMTRITLETRSVSAKLRAGDTVFGADYDRDILASDLYGDRAKRTWSLYGQRVFRPAEGLELAPSARYDGNKRWDNAGDRRIYADMLSPGLSVVYAPSFEWKFSARAARAFQAPTFADLYDPFVPAADRPANLRPERSMNYHAGARWNSASGFYAGTGGYYSLIKDRIGLDANRSFAAYNMESAFNRGVESELGYRAGRLHLSGSHTYNLSRGRVSGGKHRSITFSPLHRAALAAELRAGAAGALCRARYTGKQYTGRAHTGLRIPDYLVADAKVSYIAGNLEISGGAENVLDRHYAETADTANGYYPQPGRVWTISLKAAF